METVHIDCVKVWPLNESMLPKEIRLRYQTVVHEIGVRELERQRESGLGGA
jgi:hypothetical protein